MCCLLEIAMTIYGIIALAQGEISLSATTGVRGIPAYLIGILLLLTLPLIVGARLAIGILFALSNPNATPQQLDDMAQGLWCLDVLIAPGILVVAYLIAALNLGGSIDIRIVEERPLPSSRENQPIYEPKPPKDLPNLPFDDT